jgi:hypothetical protein
LPRKNLHFITFYIKADKFVQAIIRYLSGNISAEVITVALQETNYNFISVKQATFKCANTKAGATHISLSFVLVTLARNKKAQEIFKLTTLHNTVVKVDPKTGLHNATTVNVLPTYGCTAEWTSPRQTELRVRLARRGNCRIQQVTEAAVMQSRNYSTEKNLQATTPGSAGRTFFTKHTTPDRSFVAALRSSDEQHRQEPSEEKQQQSSGNTKHQDINQTSGQSVQTENVNMNNVIFQHPVALCRSDLGVSAS